MPHNQVDIPGGENKLFGNLSYPAQQLYETDRIINARNLPYRQNKEHWKNLLLKIAGDNPSKYTRSIIDKACYAPEPDHVLVESPLARSIRLGKQYWRKFLHVA